MRVVIDTNILVSFALWPSAEFEKIFDFVAARGVSLISDETLAELFIVLNREKFRRFISEKAVIDYVEWYAGISESVSDVKAVIGCRDPKDDKFLALATSGKADCIIAGDKDLLDMKEFQGIPIHRPADFVKLFVRE